MPTVLTSHLGYNTAASKKAVVRSHEPVDVRSAALVEAATGTRTELAPGPEVTVDRWSLGTFRRIDFSHVRTAGEYVVEITTPEGTHRSEPFPIRDGRLQAATLSDCLNYFKAVRSSGEIDRKDRAARFYGDDSGRTVDARGGWLDASGDFSKFLSHLNYTRMMSPQQTPLCAWAFLAARDELRTAHPRLAEALGARLRDEALHGADFLVRFQSPEGYFYTGIFDALTKDLDERVINAPLQDSVRTQRWQAAYRMGGGLAVAALARASTAEDHGDFTAQEYLAAARRGFAHLEEHNTDYLYDGTETVLDDYCALLAAAELTAAVPEEERAPFLAAAERRAASLADRYTDSGRGFGYLRGDAEGRPFFHAAEPGLPAVALLRFAEVCPGSPLADRAVETALTLAKDAVFLADEVANPFGYARQFMQPKGEEPRTGFFFPHENETGYWWQGENAGICSTAYAALRAAALPACDERLRARLRVLAEDQLQWVVGLNPYDSSMMQGRGRNQAEYSAVYQNVPGGILNGITGGVEDEHDIAFMPEEQVAAGVTWRWAEQWIPHSAWFLLAASAGR
ncbi:glycoside hydrolase family 9 protein [Streptomyces sp. NPDC056161]|uniref:glycoside hydrolase family 9 protein n=1 Tax=Streptomyces sp. NPDC056161 TaxID=3345732 RepID=UPI0035E3025E